MTVHHQHSQACMSSSLSCVYIAYDPQLCCCLYWHIASKQHFSYELNRSNKEFQPLWCAYPHCRAGNFKRCSASKELGSQQHVGTAADAVQLGPLPKTSGMSAHPAVAGVACSEVSDAQLKVGFGTLLPQISPCSKRIIMLGESPNGLRVPALACCAPSLASGTCAFVPLQTSSPLPVM